MAASPRHASHPLHSEHSFSNFEIFLGPFYTQRLLLTPFSPIVCLNRKQCRTVKCNTGKVENYGCQRRLAGHTRGRANLQGFIDLVRPYHNADAKGRASPKSVPSTRLRAGPSSPYRKSSLTGSGLGDDEDHASCAPITCQKANAAKVGYGSNITNDSSLLSALAGTAGSK